MPMFALHRILLVILLLTPAAVSAQVVISELGWAGSDLSTADEWLELAPTDLTVNPQSLSGWTLHVGQATEPMIRFSDLSASGAIVVSNYAEAQSRLSLVPAYVTTAVSLPNVGLLLELRRPDGSVADSVVLGDRPAGHTGAGGGIWASAERIDPLRSGADPANWRTSEGSIGFDVGAPMFGSPGLVAWLTSSSSLLSSWSSSEMSQSSSESVASSSASVDSFEGVSQLAAASSIASSSVSAAVSSTRATALVGKFRITEVLADPEGSDDGEWIEVANVSGETIDVSGVLLQRRGLSRSYRFVDLFGSDASLEPDEYILISREQSLLTLPNAGGEIMLTDGEEVIDLFQYPAATEGVSYGIWQGSLSLFCTPTPGRSNEQSLPTARLFVQGGTVSGVGRVSLNVAANVPDVPGAMQCQIDFGDGSIANTCNPTSHTFSSVGSYDVSLMVSTACGVITGEGLVVSVLGEPADVIRTSAITAASSSSQHSDAVPKVGIVQRSCSPSAATGVSLAGALPNPAEDDEKAEEIRLVNTSSVPADLCGWTLDDGPEGSTPFSLDGIVLLPGEEKRLPRTLTKIALNNDGDAIRLFMPGQSEPFSEIQYDDADEDEWILFGFNKGSTNKNDQKSSTIEKSIYPFMKTKNQIPVELNLATSAGDEGDIVISEILSHPTKGETEWIELENVSSSTVDLSGWVLDDDPSGGSGPWVLPRGTSMAPQSFLVFTRADSRLSLNDGGDSVELRRGSQVMDSIDVPSLKAGLSYALLENGEWCITTAQTPNAVNHCLSAVDVQPKGKRKKTPASGSSSPDLLASLSASRRSQSGGLKDRENPEWGWIVWIGVVIGLLGLSVWIWMHFDEWQWKLQQSGK